MAHNSSDDRLFRVENKVDDIKDTLSKINVTLAAQHESLKEHMARTRLLEARVSPLETHSVMVAGAGKLIGMIVGALSVIATIVKILEFFRK